MTLLARRDYSQKELLQKLKAKHFAEEEVRAVLAELIAEGLLNEARFIEQYIVWRSNKGYGPERISAELDARCGKTAIIAEQLAKTTPEVDWQSKIFRVWQKRFKGEKPQDFASKVKQMRFLQYRGFNHDQIEYLFRSIKE